MIHTFALTAGLVLLWLLLSGYFLALILALGIASIVLVVWIAHRMDVVDHESHPIHMAFKGLIYFPWLMWEIVKANIDVALAILKGNNAIAPKTMRITASQRSDVGRVTYANSITLTPGTVTVHVDGDIFTTGGVYFGATDTSITFFTTNYWGASTGGYISIGPDDSGDPQGAIEANNIYVSNKLGIGSGFDDASGPANTVGVSGNMAIGSSYAAKQAPDNGLIIFA